MKTLKRKTPEMNSALRHRLQHLLRLGARGLLAGDAEALAVLFVLARPLLEGEDARTAEELTAWFEAEASAVS